VEAEVQEAGVEAGRPAGEAHVAGKGEVHPRADRGPVDGGHRRQRRPGDPQEPLVDGEQGLAGAAGEVAEVGAGAEGGRCAGHDHRADPAVRLEAVEGGDDPVDHRLGQRVAAPGVVEDDDGDAVPRLGANAHRDDRSGSRTTAGECRKNCSTSRSYV
jgi:hypothetical protein